MIIYWVRIRFLNHSLSSYFYNALQIQMYCQALEHTCQ